MNRFFSITLLFLFVATSPSYGQTWFSEEGLPAGMAGFSQALAIDGSTIIATRTGASILYPSPTSQKGGVFIYEKSSDGWDIVQTLIPNSVDIGDRFGHDIAFNEYTLAVSAPMAMNGCGLVHTFRRDNASAPWQYHSALAHPSCRNGGRLGWSLAFDNATLIAGAPGDKESSGHVVSYELNQDNRWEPVMIRRNPKDGTLFGESIAVSEDGLLVGAPGDDYDTGIVHAYKRGGETPDGTLKPSGHDISLFGLEIAVQGDIALISAPGMRIRERGSESPEAGSVQVFTYTKNKWKRGKKLTLPRENGESSRMERGFGAALGIQGNQAWVGAPNAGSLGGSVYIYDTQNDWEVAQILTTRPLAPQATFGSQLAVSETMAVIGAPRADFGEGRGIVYMQSENGWQEDAPLSDNGRNIEAITGEAQKCIDGQANMFSCEKVDLLSFLPIKDIGGETGVIVNDIWGWTDPETGNEYAIIGRSNGVSFIDVTDPSMPVYLGNLPATEGSTPNHWRDVKVYKNHAFVVADGVGKHGMQIFDLTTLRSVQNRPATFKETVLYEPIYSAHNVIINDDTGFAYIVAASAGGETCGGGYHMVDVKNPVEPVFAGCFSDPSSGAGGNHIHDAQCVLYDGPDQDYQGKEICFGANASVFSIADVTDKKNPVTVSALDYPNVAYVHQGWLTKDKKYFYINDEGDEVSGIVDATRTLIWDVTDLDDPVYLKAYMGTTQASDHNFYVKDDLMYQSNYASGLQIIDVSDPVNPREVAHFDTVPWGDNAPGFSGSWSNYPYFESGTILVSSITEGLFLLKKVPEQLP